MRATWLALIMILAILMIGCSSSDGVQAPTTAPLPAKESNGLNHHLWGFYTVAVDFQNQTVEAVRDRDIEFHLNAVGFLEPPACATCLRLDNFVWGTNHLSLDVGFLHPFAGLTEFAGFDVRGIVMFNGKYSFPSLDLTTKGPGDGGLDNPDGYTTLYSSATDDYKRANMGSAVPPNATLNGFINHYHLDTRHMFRATGTPVYHKYEIDFPTNGSFLTYFNYAVDASWEFPAQVPADIDDFSINANAWEAYQITTQLDGLITAQSGSSADLKIYLYDWQGVSTIDNVVVESPELFTGTKSASFMSMGPNPDGGEWALYTATISNDKANLDPEEPFRVLIAAEDVTNDTEPMDITAYQIYEGSISPNEPPVAIGKVDNDNPSTGTEVHFTGHDSYDPEDGAVSEYHWDLDGDGAYDDSEEPDPSWSYDTEGTYYADLKVYDSLGAWDTLDVKIKIEVVDTGIEVTLVEYVNEGLNYSGNRQYPCGLFTGAPSGVVYQWNSGPKLEEDWDFTSVSLPSSGFRSHQNNPWNACDSGHWGSDTAIETYCTGNAANLLYQKVFILDWVYHPNYSGENGTLQVRGWDGWDEISYPFGPTYCYADDILPSSATVTFPLNIDHTGTNVPGSGTLWWFDAFSGCTSHSCSYNFRFDVIGEGTVKTSYYSTPEPCLLTRAVYHGSMSGGYQKLTCEMIWYEWVTEDGAVAAFMTTFNNTAGQLGLPPPATTRFTYGGSYNITGQCVFAARSS